MRRYAYDAQGALLDPPAVIEALPGGEIAIQVPQDGLVIVESSAR